MDQRVKHRLQIEGRAADNLEDIGRRSLLAQGLLKLARARLLGFEQARVLDGYNSLTCKILKKLNLLVGERSYLLAIDGEDTNKAVLFYQRYNESGTRSAALYGANNKRIASEITGALPKVRRVNWLAVVTKFFRSELAVGSSAL